MSKNQIKSLFRSKREEAETQWISISDVNDSFDDYLFIYLYSLYKEEYNSKSKLLSRLTWPFKK